jgi:hypothetical protein
MIEFIIVLFSAVVLAVVLWIICTTAWATVIRVKLKNGFDQMSSTLAIQALIATLGAYQLIQAFINVVTS